MDFPVKATVQVDRFQDGRAVRRLLRSHGFEVTDLGRGQLRVEGSFQRLREVKARLEQLMETTALPPASSGAIPKNSSRNGADEGRGRAPGSLRRPPASQEPRTSSGPKLQEPNYGTAAEPIVIDSDVYRYAKHFRTQELDELLTREDVQPLVKEEEESTIITFQGGSSRMGRRDLQLLLEDLSRSLRTQEVLLADLGSQGKHLLGKIRGNNNAWASVLVCETDGRLHLVGPSKQSYDLKQSLQGGPVDQSGGRGRSADQVRRQRSRSVPARSRRSPAGGDGGAAGGGFSSWTGDGQEAAGRSGPPRGRSLSESRAEQEEEKLRRRDHEVQAESAEGRSRGRIFRRFRKAFSWLKMSKKKTKSQ